MRQTRAEIAMGRGNRKMAKVSGAMMLHDEYDMSPRISQKSSESVRKTSKFLVSEAELAFSWNQINLRLIGLWPDQTCNASLITRCSSLMWGLLLFSFVVAPQALAPIAYNFVLSDLSELISAVAGHAAGVFKIVVLWYNGEAWCLISVSDDWTRKLSPEDRETMMKNARLGRSISIGVTIFVQCLVWSYVILQVVQKFSKEKCKTSSLLTLNLDARNATEFGKQLFYPSYFPFDLSKASNFAFAWCGQCVGLLYCGLAYSGTDSFVAILVIHLCGQITILRHSIANVIDDDTTISYETFRVKLRLIVKRHHTLIRFGTVIKETVSWLLLVLIIACTIQLGLQLFRLLAAVTEHEPGKFPFVQVISLLSFLNATFIHLFVYCYVGDMLIEESEALEMASYSCRWYNLSGKCANDVKLVMCRAKVPLQMWAGKFAPFSLELFGKVLKTSISYFSVLLTMKEQYSER